ncbi:nucleotidyltransferase domain-containing protein [Candidatus Gottesmanbacteria bacterium]|nr:nucleotidyltransferase domain-containing protein [Candidatus Gottesmanbacteria bacterium]
MKPKQPTDKKSTNDTIIATLREIEKTHQVTILYAVESGSRAWGFASKDSDYDIRFVYHHPLEWYISIEDKTDVIEHPMIGPLDICGWDIRKALALYKKSNPPLYEWLVSPIVYKERGTFAQQLRSLMPTYYAPIASIHHYLHMARGNYRQYLQGSVVWVKKYFYVLRPIFACMWIEHYSIQAPMAFITMLERLPLDENVREEVWRLYERKKLGEELDKGNRIAVLNDFVDEKIQYFEKYAQEIKPERKIKLDPSRLDRILYDTLNQTPWSRLRLHSKENIC